MTSQADGRGLIHNVRKDRGRRSRMLKFMQMEAKICLEASCRLAKSLTRKKQCSDVQVFTNCGKRSVEKKIIFSASESPLFPVIFP